ncbi:MAG TPA: type III pantothenate kinase [Treponema sp.]|jgi:type III pantothenate kinase|nr:type III pantothenate kinase [Treponema sp.]HBB42347.1 type III pantothenate kinase [Treponema sp.]HCA19531.1 type III pantothenate kinase [Treponema sp.]
MLFALDIGNTNVVAAVFDGDKILCQWRIASDARRTGDEYTSVVLTLMRDAGISGEDIDKSIISSVVPDLIGPFITVCNRITRKKPYVLRSTLSLDGTLPVRLPGGSTHELGTDLLCNAVGAWKMFGEANIVVDFGTALTLTVTDSKGIIQGITISPGLRTAIHSLASNTAQLPVVPLEAPPSSLGSTTKEAIQAGVVLGYKGLVEYLISQVKADLKKISGDSPESVHVVATGGLNSVLKPLTDAFQVVDKELTLKGLKAVSDIIQGKSGE